MRADLYGQEHVTLSYSVPGHVRHTMDLLLYFLKRSKMKKDCSTCIHESFSDACVKCTDYSKWEFYIQPEDIPPAVNLSQLAKSDAGKPKLTLVPQQIIWDIAKIREYGNKKYPEGGINNWKRVEIERYRDAAYRHFLLYLADPKSVDEESKMPHLWHLACNIAFLCELERENQ